MIRLNQLVLVCALSLLFGGQASAQPVLKDTLQRYGVVLGTGGIEGAFDAGVEPGIPVAAGAFAAPLAMLVSGTTKERVAAAYAFGVLAGRSAKAVSSQDLAAVSQVLMQLMLSPDRRSRIAGARVAGRVLAVPFNAPLGNANQPSGLIDALFSLLNQSDSTEQLAAMDALGLVRASTAVTSLTERYTYYREAKKRVAAGGAVEALARIGHPSSVAVVQQLAADKWSQGKDATALAVAFARERLLKDGSIAAIQQAANNKSRRVQALRAQARGYLIELGAPVP